tara:strand:+ start:2151 stop:2282 length:132 start_codon:yes stop_codon:yes gene_type:complete
MNMQECELCKSLSVETIIDLGNTPISHEFSETEEEALKPKSIL